jgi:hypothetical protein
MTRLWLDAEFWMRLSDYGDVVEARCGDMNAVR